MAPAVLRTKPSATRMMQATIDRMNRSFTSRAPVSILAGSATMRQIPGEMPEWPKGLPC